MVGNKIDLAPARRVVPLMKTHEYVARVLGGEYAVHEVSAKDDEGQLMLHYTLIFSSY